MFENSKLRQQLIKKQLVFGVMHYDRLYSAFVD